MFRYSSIHFLIFSIFASFFGFSQQKTNLKSSIKSVKVDTIFKGVLSSRALLYDAGKVVFAGTNNQVGIIDLTSKLVEPINIFSDSLRFEFRSIAQNSSAYFVLSINNPAVLFRIDKTTHQVDKVYQENHPKAFYDAICFYNDKEAIAVGDPTEDCLSILTTSDGGISWQKQICAKSPQVVDGEAVFAASNSAIVVKKDKIFIATGGKKARIFTKNIKSNSWNALETPILQGLSMTGIFSLDFYNDKIGIIVGGDYEQPMQNYDNKALTTDGGKTWQLIADSQAFGYASCVKFVPNSNGKQIVTVGPSGLYYSADQGKSFDKLLDDPFLYTIQFIDDTTAIASGRYGIVLLKFEL
jgi:photosystem II stability/assembly factor-like uncharacterized protein